MSRLKIKLIRVHHFDDVSTLHRLAALVRSRVRDQVFQPGLFTQLVDVDYFVVRGRDLVNEPCGGAAELALFPVHLLQL